MSTPLEASSGTISDVESGVQSVQQNISHSLSNKETIQYKALVLRDDSGEKAENGQEGRRLFDTRLRLVLLCSFWALIFGWWISSTISEATRHRW